MARNARYTVEMSCIFAYWKQIYKEITSLLALQPDTFQEGFWPVLDWRRDHTRSSSMDNGRDYFPDLTPEDDPKPYPYCTQFS
jgi:hypothetical protein